MLHNKFIKENTIMKKILYWLLTFVWLNVALFSFVPTITFAQDGWFWSDRFKLIPGLDLIKSNESPSDSLLDTIANAINWALAILATVAVVLIMYAWFKMLTSWGDSKWYDAWLKIIKNAAIWLVIIWLAWLIVSAIVWLVHENAENWAMV